MVDLSVVKDYVVGDPLAIILAVVAIGGLIAHFLFRRHPSGRAIVRVICLLLLTVALLHADIVPYRPLALTGSAFLDAVHAY